MIIRLKNADFSENNIGSLSTWTITKSLGHGATYNGVNYVDRSAPLNATITIAEGYELGAAGVTVSMGGKAVTSGVTVNGNTITISIDVVTGNVKITVPTININTGEEDSGNTGGGNTGGEEEVIGIKLFQGYATQAELNTSQTNRVRSDFIYGPFTIKTNDGYVIRAIYKYSAEEVKSGVTVVSGEALTEYTFNESDKYCIITFCKTDANANILPTEDIIKEFSAVELKDCVFTINPTPANATVKINGTVQNSITVKTGTTVSYEVSADGYSTKTGSYKVNDDHTMNIELSEMVSGGTLDLYQGYSNTNTLDSELATRVRTDFIYGPFAIKTNDGYVIRAIYKYSAAAAKNGTEVVSASQNLTEYTCLDNSSYHVITFCKTDAAANVLPTENIVKEFSVPEANPLIAQLDLKVGQYLGNAWKPDNATRAVVGVPLNDYTSISTAGSNYVMIPLIDDDDTTSNGVFYTLGMSGSSYSTTSTNYVYKDTINIADVQAVNTDNKPIYVMFKRSDNANISISDLVDCITIN